MQTFIFEVLQGSYHLSFYACKANYKNEAWEKAYKWAVEAYPTRAPRVIFYSCS